jgi:alpha-L-fucosidase 2
MNVPVTYWPLYAAARFDLAATLSDFILSNTSQLRANPVGVPDAMGMGGTSSFDLISPYAVGPGAMLGNFPWICHNLHMHASFSGNASMLQHVVFPLLRGAVNVYKNFSFTGGGDGLIHLPPSYSPEYPYPRGPTNDTHFDLALFAWGARTLVALAERFSIGDPLLPYWRSVGEKLAPYPTGTHGFNVSLGVGFDVPHRHFSHLFAIFPLHNVAYEDADGGSPSTRDLIARSLDRWTGITCPQQVCPNGFTYDGAISMSALMGGSNASRREDAARLADNMVRGGLLHKSTMYSEGHQPCLESPLGLASAVQDMLLQSWGGRVRVFPGVPDSWPDAVIHGFAAEGGFRVSAVRAGGVTRWVALTAAPADAGGAAALTATLAAPTLAPPFTTEPPGVPVSVLPSGDLQFNVTVGATVVIAGVGVAPPFVVQALPGNSSEFNFWGDH